MPSLKGMRVGFSSNGTLLLKNNNLSNILNSHLDWIAFSVDGATKETYEKIRVGARFEDIVQGIGKLNQEKKKMHLVTPEIRLNCCVQEDNYEEVKTQRRKFYEIFKGIDIFEFGTVSTRGKKENVCLGIRILKHPQQLENIFIPVTHFIIIFIAYQMELYLFVVSIMTVKLFLGTSTFKQLQRFGNQRNIKK